MTPRNPAYAEAARAIFERAPFIKDLGLRVLDVGPGRCEAELSLAPRLRQQHGFAHAGVVGTVADHTAGAAGTTLVGADEAVLTVEFKVNLLRPAAGDVLRCRARVLRSGRSILVAQSEVSVAGPEETLAAVALVTLAVRGHYGG